MLVTTELKSAVIPFIEILIHIHFTVFVLYVVKRFNTWIYAHILIKYFKFDTTSTSCIYDTIQTLYMNTTRSTSNFDVIEYFHSSASQRRRVVNRVVSTYVKNKRKPEETKIINFPKRVYASVCTYVV